MLRVIIFVLAVAGAATQALAQSADKAIIAHTSESISARRFRLDTPVAEESYRIVRQSLSDDGTIA